MGCSLGCAPTSGASHSVTLGTITGGSAPATARTTTSAAELGRVLPPSTWRSRRTSFSSVEDQARSFQAMAKQEESGRRWRGRFLCYLLSLSLLFVNIETTHLSGPRG